MLTWQWKNIEIDAFPSVCPYLVDGCTVSYAKNACQSTNQRTIPNWRKKVFKATNQL